MFVRIKKIHDLSYAYLVESVWTEKGSRQKTKAYLGRIYDMGAPEVCVPEFEDVEQFFEDLLSQLLEKTGFHKGVSLDGPVWQKDGITVSLEHLSVISKKRPCVLAINGGFLCEHTLTFLREALENPTPSSLAQSLLGIGCIIEEIAFIELYHKDRKSVV